MYGFLGYPVFHVKRASKDENFDNSLSFYFCTRSEMTLDYLCTLKVALAPCDQVDHFVSHDSFQRCHSGDIAFLEVNGSLRAFRSFETPKVHEHPRERRYRKEIAQLQS